MKEADAEIVLQKGAGKTSGGPASIISDNGPR